MSTTNPSNDVREKVREGYAQIAQSGVWLGVNAHPDFQGPEAAPATSGGCCGGGGCRPAHPVRRQDRG